MLLVNGINSDAKQKHVLFLPDGTNLTMILEYKSTQYGWFLSSLTYGTFVVTNVRVCTSPNFLHQFHNQIPFGMAVFTEQQDEPTQQQDFLSGRSTFYLLSQAETTQYAEIISGQIQA